MVKTMALNDLKYWDARSTKKKKKKARHVILKSSPWSLTIPIPFPTGSKRLARRSSLNLNLPQPSQEKIRESTGEGKERGRSKH